MHFDPINRLVLEYALNALWQVPLLTAAGWLLARAVRLAPLAEHRLWLVILAVCVLLPLNGIYLPAPVPTVSVHVAAENTNLILNGVTPADLRPEGTLAAPAPAPPAFELHRSTRFELSGRTLRILGAIYAALVSLALLRLARGTLSARRLLQDSFAYAMDEAEQVLWQELNHSLQLALPPSAVCTSPQIASPVVVGILHPALLVPTGFHLCSEAERRAALAHELAHIARRDTLTHAVCQVLALPLIWHPLVHAVQTQIARTREMICDAIAARSMPSDFAYARCLLSLAQHLLRDENIPQPGAGMGLFRNHKLEERVIELTEAKAPLTPTQRWTRGATAAAALLLTGAAATLIHLTPVMAQSSQPAQTQSVVPAAPAAPPVEPVIPVPAPAPSPAAIAPLPEAPVPPPAPPAPKVDASSDVLLQTEPGEVDDHGHLFAIAHGRNAHVILHEGGHIHRWTGADGQPWELMNDQAADLTPQQQRDAEAECNRQIEQARDSLAKATAKLNSNEFRQHFAGLTKGQLKQLEELKNMPQLKIDLKEIDPKAMAELKDLKVDPKFNFDFSGLDAVNSPAMEKTLADAEKRVAEATKRLEAATKALEKAQKQLDEKTPH
jgi:beta-lactamase regulating signal transducer with metallopeptidase domain